MDGFNDEYFYSPLTRSVRCIPEILFDCDMKIMRISPIVDVIVKNSTNNEIENMMKLIQ